MKKPSWIERAKDLFGPSEEKDEQAYERTMHKLGIDILKDQKLEHRVKLMMRFEDAITASIETANLIEYVRELKDRQDLLNHALYEISAPFGRAGDIPRFGKMFHGWGRLNASAASWILRTFDIVSKTAKQSKPEAPKTPEKPKTEAKGKDQEKNEEPVAKTTDNIVDEAEELLEEFEAESIDPRFLVQSLHDVLQKHIWKAGFLILGQCFLDRDVSPRASTVIQNVNAQREREDMTRKPDFQ